MAERPLILDEFIPYRLSVTSNLVSDAIARSYEALFGLTIPEWRLVAVVAERDGITQQAIGATTRMDKVTVSRAAIALVDRGLLARAANPDDRRSHLLRLTVTLSIRVRAPISACVIPPVSATTATSRHSGIVRPNSAS